MRGTNWHWCSYVCTYWWISLIAPWAVSYDPEGVDLLPDNKKWVHLICSHVQTWWTLSFSGLLWTPHLSFFRVWFSSLGFRGQCWRGPCIYQFCPRSVASLSRPAWAEWCWKIRANTELGWRVGKKRGRERKRGRKEGGLILPVSFFIPWNLTWRLGLFVESDCFFTVYLCQSWPGWPQRWLTRPTEACFCLTKTGVCLVLFVFFFFFCRFYTLSPGIVPLSVHQLLLQFWSHCSRRCSRPIGCWLWTQGRLSRCHGYSKQEMPWSRYCFRPCSGVSPVCLRGETRLVAVAPSFPSALTMPPFFKFFFFFLQPRSWTRNSVWRKMLCPETSPEIRHWPENSLSAAS